MSHTGTLAQSLTSKALVVHIGMPKTGTTFMQNYLFPELGRLRGFLYNPKEFQTIKNKRLTYSADEKKALNEVCEASNVLISQEQLVDWNPRNWERAADRVLALFGPNATIVITVREPYEYLRSVYIQKMQEGNVYLPEDFFVTSKQYDALSPFLAERSLIRFDYESFCYRTLEKIYRDRFPNVHIAPLTRLKTLYPWTQVFNLSDVEQSRIRDGLERGRPLNKSYSRLAVRLTVRREIVLRFFGLKSVGTEDPPTYNDNIFLGGKNLKEQRAIGFDSLPVRRKASEWLRKVIRKVVKPWRWWMQHVLDRWLPYKKYELPNHLTRFDVELMKENERFVKNLEELVDRLVCSASGSTYRKSIGPQ